jgi:sulfur carrier protein ThiS
MINVRLYSTLTKYCSRGTEDTSICVEFESNMTIRTLMGKLGIVEEKEVMLVAVNGEVKGQNYEYIVQDGDNISLYGLIAGG